MLFYDNTATMTVEAVIAMLVARVIANELESG
jgi:hypothetical protein